MKNGKKDQEYLGKVKFYADESLDMDLINYLRDQKHVNIVTAIELGYAGRDDDFQFKAAYKQKRFLLTTDQDFLNHSKYPLNQMFGIVALDIPQRYPGLGWMALRLTKDIVPSGKGILGTKCVVHKRYIGYLFSR